MCNNQSSRGRPQKKTVEKKASPSTSSKHSASESSSGRPKRAASTSRETRKRVSDNAQIVPSPLQEPVQNHSNNVMASQKIVVQDDGSSDRNASESSQEKKPVQSTPPVRDSKISINEDKMQLNERPRGRQLTMTLRKRPPPPTFLRPTASKSSGGCPKKTAADGSSDSDSSDSSPEREPVQSSPPVSDSEISNWEDEMLNNKRSRGRQQKKTRKRASPSTLQEPVNNDSDNFMAPKKGVVQDNDSSDSDSSESSQETPERADEELAKQKEELAKQKKMLAKQKEEQRQNDIYTAHPMSLFDPYGTLGLRPLKRFTNYNIRSSRPTRSTSRIRETEVVEEGPSSSSNRDEPPQKKARSIYQEERMHEFDAPDDFDLPPPQQHQEETIGAAVNPQIDNQPLQQQHEKLQQEIAVIPRGNTQLSPPVQLNVPVDPFTESPMFDGLLESLDGYFRMEQRETMGLDSLCNVLIHKNNQLAITDAEQFLLRPYYRHCSTLKEHDKFQQEIRYEFFADKTKEFTLQYMALRRLDRSDKMLAALKAEQEHLNRLCGPSSHLAIAANPTLAPTDLFAKLQQKQRDITQMGVERVHELRCKTEDLYQAKIAACLERLPMLMEHVPVGSVACAVTPQAPRMESPIPPPPNYPNPYRKMPIETSASASMQSGRSTSDSQPSTSTEHSNGD